jgi:hypothetical protein
MFSGNVAKPRVMQQVTQIDPNNMDQLCPPSAPPINGDSTMPSDKSDY